MWGVARRSDVRGERVASLGIQLGITVLFYPHLSMASFNIATLQACSKYDLRYIYTHILIYLSCIDRSKEPFNLKGVAQYIDNCGANCKLASTASTLA